MFCIKEMAMSNETDLDWLARNVHVWPSSSPDRTFDNAALSGWEFSYGEFRYGKSVVTKDQWLSRRAELQSVTEQFKPSIEEANRLAQEFKLFTSIEDNQEQEMKQDNGWYERGDLPPVGVECDIRHSCWNSEKYEKVTVAAITNEYVIVKCATFEQHYMLKDISFRPIRTEREVLISVIIDEMNRYDTDAKLADAILAAGFKLEVK